MASTTSGKKYMGADTNWLNGLGQSLQSFPAFFFFLICKMGLITLIL